jgi:hypothetical protein
MNPYLTLPPESFWRSAVADTHPLSVSGLYRKKFSIEKTDRVATGGSCFAQHVATRLRYAGFNVLDAEPAPPTLGAAEAAAFGYGIYSARYGNIYTARQLVQLLRDAESGSVRDEDIWLKDGRWYDGLRPGVEPEGLASPEAVRELRLDHLLRVRDLFRQTDVLVFTLGLTECWMHAASGTVYPMCPGTIAGDFDPTRHVFRNFDFNDVLGDLQEARALLQSSNPGMRLVLTVSPVPLTATASGEHVLVATTYSKSTLRAACGAMAAKHPDVDYFPSYEIIATPFSRGFFYEANLRSVSAGGVAAVMQAFFAEHGGDAGHGAEHGEGPSAEEAAPVDRTPAASIEDDLVCEERLLEAFQP